MLKTTPRTGVVELRFFDSPRSVRVVLAGMDPSLERDARDHWTAEWARTVPARSAGAPVLAVERGDAGRPCRRPRVSSGGGDLLSLPGGSLRVSPEDDVVVASLRSVRDGEEHLLLDVLDAGLALLLARQQVLMLHGAAFGLPAGGVLAVGGSGSGKSTLTAAALGAGARVVTDDTVLVRASGRRLEAGPFRSHLGFRSDPAPILPAPAASALARLDGPGWSWWRLDLASLPDRSRTIAPTRFWVLSVDRRLRRSRSRRLSQSECLAALMASASPLVLSPRYRRTRAALLPLLQDLAEGCGGWRIRLGRDLVSDPVGELGRLLHLSS